MMRDFPHKIYDDDDNALYRCSTCKEYKHTSAFYTQKNIPQRDNISYRCRECVSTIERAKRQPPMDMRKEVNRIFEILGYDLSDLENNPIHLQFEKRFQEREKEREERRKTRQEQEPEKVKRKRKGHILINGKQYGELNKEEMKLYMKLAYARYRNKIKNER